MCVTRDAKVDRKVLRHLGRNIDWGGEGGARQEMEENGGFGLLVNH